RPGAGCAPARRVHGAARIVAVPPPRRTPARAAPRRARRAGRRRPAGAAWPEGTRTYVRCPGSTATEPDDEPEDLREMRRRIIRRDSRTALTAKPKRRL